MYYYHGHGDDQYCARLEPCPGVYVLRGKNVQAPEDSELLYEVKGLVVVRCSVEPTNLPPGVTVSQAVRRVGDKRPDSFLGPSGRVAVRFPSELSREQCKGVLFRHELRIVEDIDGMPNGFFVSGPGDGIDEARLLVEEDKAMWAEPDFIMQLSLRKRGR